MNSTHQLHAMNHSLRLTVKDIQSERYERSGKHTEIEENIEGPDFSGQAYTRLLETSAGVFLIKNFSEILCMKKKNN